MSQDVHVKNTVCSTSQGSTIFNNRYALYAHYIHLHCCDHIRCQDYMDLYGFTICIAMIGTVFAQEDFLRESFGSRVSVGKAWDSRETGSLKFLCTSKREKEKEVGGTSYFAKNETQPPMYIKFRNTSCKTTNSPSIRCAKILLFESYMYICLVLYFRIKDLT